MVQLPPFAGMVPADSATDPVPAVAVTVPPQVFVELAGLARTKPPGKVSVKAVPVAAEVPVLPSVIVSVEIPPTVADAGEKVLFTVTAACATVVISKNAIGPKVKVMACRRRFLPWPTWSASRCMTPSRTRKSSGFTVRLPKKRQLPGDLLLPPSFQAKASQSD